MQWLLTDELVVDNFAGGGGASTGMEWALQRPVNVAVNHDREAVAMHSANHPATRHYCENVFAMDPYEVCGGRPVGLAWFSPDCTHHSKAKGGKPRKKNIRGLAWIVTRWARTVRPRVIILENVEEFEDWGPLDENGLPCPDRKGSTFRFWLGKLERYGYRMDWWQLRACDYGSPTIRKRLILVARRDGLPIIKPEATHGPDGSGLLPYRTAADCIDWSLPCPSIFDRKKPLVPATLARIAKGVQRFVIDSADPFIIPVTHQGDSRVYGLDEPMRTVTTAKRGEFALIAPFIKRDFGMGVGRRADGPMPTIMSTGGGKMSLVAAFMAQHNTGAIGHPIKKPFSTIMGTGGHQQIVTSHLVKFRGTCRDGQRVDAPAPTITAGGTHIGEVRAFLVKYYGEGGQHADVRDPMHTLTAKARMGLVTVAGEEYQIADIGMRMLHQRELYRAQGFPDSYIIDLDIGGKRLTKEAQIRMCGNSVCPQVAAAVTAANMGIGSWLDAAPEQVAMHA